MNTVLLPEQDSATDLNADRPASFEVVNSSTGSTEVFAPDADGVTHIPAGRYKPTRVYRIPEGYECHVLDNQPPVGIEDTQE